MKRIAIFGNAGGGKSTLAHELADLTGLPLAVIDKLQFAAGGAEVPHEEFLRAHAALLATDEWIIDGFGGIQLAWERFEAADTLVHVDLPLAVHFLWVTKRLVKGLFAPPPGWPQDSPIVRSSISSYRVLWPCHTKLTPRYRSYVSQAARTKRVFHLRSTRELKQFVQQIRRECAPVSDPLPLDAGGCVLRRLATSDLREFQAYRSDPLLGRYQGWSMQSDEEVRAFLCKMSSAELFQPGSWTQIGIADAGGSLIGDMGLFLAADGRSAEIGITLRHQSQGSGVATAAAKAAIALVFERTSAEKVLGIVDIRNQRSISMLQRLGMRRVDTRESVCRGESCTEDVYALLRAE